MFVQAENPLLALAVDGHTCRLHRNSDQHGALERGDGLIPWNGRTDNMIDRFDGRALLDMYREPDAAVLRNRAKTYDEIKLEEVSTTGTHASGNMSHSIHLVAAATIQQYMWRELV